MTHGDGGGLMVDAEVRRGSFTLEVSLAAAPGQVAGGSSTGGSSTGSSSSGPHIFSSA